MVDSRQKGARAEAAAKKLLIDYTGLNWQRTPSSGALDEKHGLKGDLYIPQERNTYCLEVKHYKSDHLTSKILTDKKPQIIKWWEQTEREAKQVKRIPLLIFKFDRSKWFVAFYGERDVHSRPYPNLKYNDLVICKLEDWLEHDEPEFIE